MEMENVVIRKEKAMEGRRRWTGRENLYHVLFKVVVRMRRGRGN